MTNQNNNNTPANSNNLFDIRVGSDGKFRVWTQKSELDLGIITREEYEAAGRPVFMNQMRWVVVSVHDKRPTVNSVLESLGVKRKEPNNNGAQNKGGNGNKTRHQSNRPTTHAQAA